MTDSEVPKILLLGLDEKRSAEIRKMTAGSEYIEMPIDLEKFMDPIALPPLMIIVGAPPVGIALDEVAQLLRSLYPQAMLYHVADVNSGTDRKALLKDGFSEVFLLPIDCEKMDAVLKNNAAAAGLKEVVFRNVKVLDFQPDTVLDFNTYLFMPANMKHIKFSSAGDVIDEERVEKLKSHSVSSLSVPLGEMKQFYKYTATVLKKIGDNTEISATERSERLESSVRELILGLYSGAATSTQEGKGVVVELQNIVKNYIAISSPAGSKNWYEHVLAMMAENANAYSQATATSTFASIFAMGLGLRDVEDVALAGLLHDIGMSKLPSGMLATPQGKWSESDRQLYESHPEISLSIIKERKLVVSENVHKIILQHHENYDGSGFPRKVVGERICMGAQLLAIADVIYEATKLTPGKPQPTPLEVIERLHAEADKSSGKEKHNPILLKKIAAMFKAND